MERTVAVIAPQRMNILFKLDYSEAQMDKQ